MSHLETSYPNAQNTVSLRPDQASPDAGTSDRDRSSHSLLLEIVERFGLLILLTAGVLLFSLLPASSTTFPTAANVQNILGGQVVLTLIAIGFMFPLAVGYFDLSVASAAGLASVASAAAMSRFHAGLAVAVVIGIAFGSLVGIVNAILVTILKLDSIIVTLATMTAIAGIIQLYTGGLSINGNISQSLTSFCSGTWFGIPKITYILAVFVLLTWYLLEHTPLGRYVRMVGSNRAAARLVGLNVDRLVMVAFVIAGVLAGIAGVLMTGRTGGANPQSGPGYLMPGLAAVFLGTTAIQPSRFNIFGTVSGVFFVAVFVSGLTLIGVAPWVEPVFDAGALLVAVVLSTTLRRLRAPERL